APALAQADVGIAMGTGTDIAMEAADITLVKGNLRSVATALDLSRATMRVIKQNLFWAFAYNTLLIPLAIASPAIPPLREGAPIFGAAAMALSSVTVVSNSLRLRQFSRRHAVAQLSAWRLPFAGIWPASIRHLLAFARWPRAQVTLPAADLTAGEQRDPLQ